jgi:hypothetical protein
LVDELHSKLRKIENNCEEGSQFMTSRTANSVSASPISSTNSKFYKNLKKIKRNHGAENATKNYYLAFPALNVDSSQKKAKQINDEKTPHADDNVLKGESSLNLLSWSHLMSNKEPSTRSSQFVQENDKFRSAKTSRKRQRRFEKGCKRFHQKTDVQLTTKRYDMYDNATFSPKKMQMVKSCNKKHQRNQHGEHYNNY